MQLHTNQRDQDVQVLLRHTIGPALALRQCTAARKIATQQLYMCTSVQKVGKMSSKGRFPTTVDNDGATPTLWTHLRIDGMNLEAIIGWIADDAVNERLHISTDHCPPSFRAALLVGVMGSGHVWHI